MTDETPFPPYEPPPPIAEPPFANYYPSQAVEAGLTLLHRGVVALERIADRLDSWSHNPEGNPGRFGPEPDVGPELRVRR